MMDHAGRWTTSGLAVLGAFFLGAVIFGAATNFVTRSLFGKTLPAALLRLVRVLGGLAIGLAVGVLVFSGTGGWGLGGGSAGSGSDTVQPALKPPAPTELPAPAITRLGVTLLGGARVQGQAFYMVDGEPTARTIAGMRERLTLPPQSVDAPPLLTLRIYEDSVAQDHPAVIELEAWARQNGWRVSVEKVNGTLPVAEGGRP